MKFLLDYAFPISVITPTNAASTAFLKQVCVVCAPKSGLEGSIGTITLCTSLSEVAALTDNAQVAQLFTAGMSKVYILLASDLSADIVTALENDFGGEFFTMLISSDFNSDDLTTAGNRASLEVGDLTFTAAIPGLSGNDISIEFRDTVEAGSETVTVDGNKITVNMDGTAVTKSTATQIKTAWDLVLAAVALAACTISGTAEDGQDAFAETSLEGGTAPTEAIDVGTFEGVVGISDFNLPVLQLFAVKSNFSVFYSDPSAVGKNMFFAFGKLLSNLSDWKNQQYIELPVDDGVSDLGTANSLFDDRISFGVTDDEFGKRLGLFAVGGKAIVAPYVLKNFRIDLQSRALQWFSANQPSYTLTEAALLESVLAEDVVKEYIAKNWISDGTISITLPNDNFVAVGAINVAEPKAMWRVFNQMQQTL